ncbi:MAG: hypothetical protein A2W91_05125 [Bacteroidetes bacterium GWF2_38_335]|nr:MAG: hypothetical protein A2W91_05125 [Bacteroidetes bacterium GWF2_38_335]OFY79788.1 MAG: hypothetical protein A2281_10295 [Bacteroidetes bacterium RIFOXYA12_FULL_38_20]HBS88176.1 hypothetical protein [Bacteroidales bacterium]
MTKTLFLFIVVIIFVSSYGDLKGQERAIPVNISLFNESTAIPFTRFFSTPAHPGILVGTEFNYKEKEHSRLFQTANISYFYHNYLAQGAGINTELGYERTLKSGLAFEGLFGIGYMHTFATTEEFSFSDGQYLKKTDKGNARLFPSFSIDIGYYLKKGEINNGKIFIRYQLWAEYPYSPDFIPVMTHVNLHVGAKFFINKKAKKND